MPLQNRVGPFGNLVRTTARGTLRGNRGGVLHNGHREIVRAYAGTSWITCVLQFRGLRREVMYPNRYTELFFLDEAVAFAAGHRRCAECRRDRHDAFRLAWKSTDPEAKMPSAGEMDRILQPARIEKGTKVTYETPLSTLPDGYFVRIKDDAYLVLGDALHLYAARESRRADSTAMVLLTPAPIFECFRQGYRPVIHESTFLFKNHSLPVANGQDRTDQAIRFDASQGS